MTIFVRLQQLTDGEKCGLSVESIEYGLNHENIHPSVQQCCRLFRVRCHQLVKR